MTTTAAETYRGNDRLLYGIILGVLAFWLFAQTTLNIAPTMAADLQLEQSFMNIAVSITALFSGIFIVVIGGLADRVGRVKMVMYGFGFSIVGSLLVGFAPSGRHRAVQRDHGRDTRFARSGRTRSGRTRRGSVHHARHDRGRTAPASCRRDDGREGTARCQRPAQRGRPCARRTARSCPVRRAGRCAGACHRWPQPWHCRRLRRDGKERHAWRCARGMAAGYEVRGAALSGIAAENLESGSGIASRTIASMEHRWKNGRDMLTNRDVLVIDEAGMVGTRQLERVLSHVANAGAKVVLVGDPQQLQAIEAGAAFRSIHERHGGAEIGEVRRQREDWQRDATRNLATGRTGAAIHAYDAHDMVHSAETRQQARGDLIDRWDRQRQAEPDSSRIILTHTNAEVRELNEAARDRMREAGDLGEDVRITVERGKRNFAAGDRVMFLQNERGLGGEGGGVKNGTLGTIEQVSEQSMSVRPDDGRSISFDLKDYDRIDHGYAATIYKAQGMTVDRTHVLATPGLDAHGSYVALSRHRDGMDLHYARDDFPAGDKLINTLSRDRAKDMASDYQQQIDPARDYAERRGIMADSHTIHIEPQSYPDQRRIILDGRSPDMANATPGFDGAGRPERESAGIEPGREAKPAQAKQEIGQDPEEELRSARTRALIRHARAVGVIFDADDAGRKASPGEWDELVEARREFDQVRPHGWQDAEAAYAKDESLAHEAGSGKVNRAIRALQFETELRTSPERRADRFVERWQKLGQTSQRQYEAGDMSGYKATRSAMGDMAKSLQRDPQLESILANRKRDLGISFESGIGVGRDLALSHGLGIGRGRGIGL